MQKIPLTPDLAMLYERQQDDLNKLLTRNTEAYRIWNPIYVPYPIVFDFDFGGLSNVIIREIHYLYNSGNRNYQRYYIVRKDTGEKVLLHEITQGTYQSVPQETVIPIPAALQLEASKFIFESSAKDAFPDWIEIYGDYSTIPVQLKPITRSPLKNLCGVVTKPWDIDFYHFPEKEAPIIGMVSRQRLYADHQLCFDDSDNYIFGTTKDFWGSVQSMKRLQQHGIETQMDYLSFPEYPFLNTLDRTNPATYKVIADRIHTICTHNKANGRYAALIEVGNELNNWYSGNNTLLYMDGNMLGAFMSICYDGHKGVFANTGAKQADAEIPVSMCGLATADLEIWLQLKDWVIKNRGYKTDGVTPDWPFDIYSFHAYSSLGGQRAGIAGGVCPEIGLAYYLKRLNKFRRLYAPGIKLHCGEWSGGDINAGSPLNAPAFGRYSAWQTCAMWTVRTMLLFAENEIDASSNYRIVQDYTTDNAMDGNSTIFATMALNRQEGGSVKQADGTFTGLNMNRTLSGDYMKQSFDALFNAGYIFDSRILSEPNVLKFTKDGSELYAIWATETMDISAGRPSFTENLETYVFGKSGKLKRFVDDLRGVMSTEDYIPNTPIEVRAKPVFLIVDSAATPKKWATIHVYTDKTASFAMRTNAKKTLMADVTIFDDGTGVVENKLGKNETGNIRYRSVN